MASTNHKSYDWLYYFKRLNYPLKLLKIYNGNHNTKFTTILLPEIEIKDALKIQSCYIQIFFDIDL